MTTRVRGPAGPGRLRRFAIGALTVLALLVTLAGGVLVTRLHTPSPLDRDDRGVVADALPRLTFLRGAIADGAARRMQELFPEGYAFTYLLYGLTWVDVGMRSTGHRAEALAEARAALAAVDSDAGRAAFSSTLDPPYGVFYVGWSSWLRGGVIRLAGGPAAAPAEAARFTADTDALASAFLSSLDGGGSPFLPAYPGQAWPVDSTVGIAAVRLADQLSCSSRHAALVARWLRAADGLRDPATGLLPHRADPVSGRPIEGARATSQTVALRFLREVDPAAAARDWRAFRDTYASTVVGVPGIREHPQGTDRPGDVDSGPLLLGLTASASTVAIGDAVLLGDRRTAAALVGLAEAAGLPVEFGGKRRYLGGAIPIGDAFLAWSLAAAGWIEPAAADGGPRVTGGRGGWWRLPWYAVTVGAILGAWALVWLAATGRARKPRTPAPHYVRRRWRRGTAPDRPATPAA